MKQRRKTSSAVTFHTYSPELNASTHFELYSSSHDVHTLITTNYGLSVSFYVQVGVRTASDLCHR